MQSRASHPNRIYFYRSKHIEKKRKKKPPTLNYSACIRLYFCVCNTKITNHSYTSRTIKFGGFVRYFVRDANFHIWFNLNTFFNSFTHEHILSISLLTQLLPKEETYQTTTFKFQTTLNYVTLNISWDQSFESVIDLKGVIFVVHL